MTFPNDMSKLVDGLAGTMASNSASFTSSVKSAGRTLIRRTYRIEVPAVAANGDGAVAANISPSVRMRTNGRVLGVYVHPRTASTANATNYATFAVRPVTTAGAAANVSASKTTELTGTGNITAGVPFALTVSTANSNNQFTAGQWLAPTVAMTASGVAVGACTFSIDVEEEASDAYGS